MSILKTPWPGCLTCHAYETVTKLEICYYFNYTGGQETGNRRCFSSLIWFELQSCQTESECHHCYCIESSGLYILWNDMWRHLWSITQMFTVFFIFAVYYMSIFAGKILFYSNFTVLLYIFLGDNESSKRLLLKRHSNMQIIQRCFKLQHGWLCLCCQRRRRWLSLAQSGRMLFIQAWHPLHR